MCSNRATYRQPSTIDCSSNHQSPQSRSARFQRHTVTRREPLCPRSRFGCICACFDRVLACVCMRICRYFTNRSQSVPRPSATVHEIREHERSRTSSGGLASAITAPAYDACRRCRDIQANRGQTERRIDQLFYTFGLFNRRTRQTPSITCSNSVFVCLCVCVCDFVNTTHRSDRSSNTVRDS